METKQQIDHLIELAIVQRAELKRLVEQLPVLRTYLLEQINATIEDMEPQLRSDLIEFCDEKTDGKIKEIRSLFSEAKSEFATKSEAFFVELEKGVQARYAQLAQDRALALDFADDARKGLEAAAQQEASKIPGQVSELVKQELARFPRAGELDQLRKEFSEPRGLNPRGKWKSTETYQKLDLVAYNGDSYVSNVDDNREKPSRSSVSWTLSAARGQGAGGGGISSLNDILGNPTSDLTVVGAEGSNYVRKTLTAGTNITLTETPSSITIDAAGGNSAQILTATVTNAESVAITRGQVVYAYGATGNRVSVKLAYNTSDATSAKTFGVVSDDSIAAGGVGTVTCVGVVDKLNLGTYAEGDTVYLSATPGAFTSTKPYAPNHLVYVGIIERANNGNGELYVKIQNGYELDEIHDVQITAPVLSGSTLLYDATNSLWKNARLTGTANQVKVTNADNSVTLGLESQIALSGQSLTGSSATSLLDLSTTWNTTGNPTALKLNVTNTASGSTSNLLDLQVGGTSKFKVAKDGSTSIASTTASSSTTTGALVVSGGAGVAGQGWFGDYITADGTSGAAFRARKSNNTSGSQSWSSSLDASGTWSFQCSNDNFVGANTAITLTRSGTTPTGLTVNATTASTSTTTGALVVSGGVGVGGALYTGGNHVIGTGNQVTIRTVGSGLSATPTANIDIQDTNDSSVRLWRSVSEFVQLAAARGGFTANNNVFLFDVVGPNAAQTRALTFRSSIDGGTSYKTSLQLLAFSNNIDPNVGVSKWTSNAINDVSTVASGTNPRLVANQFEACSLTATNASVTTTDAATIYVTGGPTASTNQTITNSWGLWNVGKTRLDGLTKITDTTASSSITTGALVVSGGVGVAGALYSGSNIISSGGTGTGTIGVGTANAILHTVSNAPRVSLVRSLSTANARVFDFINQSDGVVNFRFISDDGNSAATAISIVGSSSAVSYVSIPNTTASTSTTTGALVVSGGAGIAGELYVGGGVVVSNGYVFRSLGAAYLDSASGANVYIRPGASGGIRVQSNLTAILATAGSSSTTSGALTVAGGLGVVENINAGGSIKSTSATAGIGYLTGAGGTVTQATSRTTGVTLDKVCGAITLVSAAGSTSWQSFTVTNSAVAATDVVRVVQKSGTDKYQILVTAVAAGSFEITYATTGGTTTEQPVFNFSVLKAVTA